MVTASLGFALQAATCGAVVVSTLLLFIFHDLYSPQMLTAHMLLQLGALLVLSCLEVISGLAVVALAAEAWLRGAGTRCQSAGHALCRDEMGGRQGTTTGLVRMDVALMFTQCFLE